MTHTDDRPPAAVPYDDPPFDPDYDAPPNGARGRTPTADRLAEQAVLATLIHTPTLAPTLSNTLTRDDFYWPVHSDIWDAWHHLAAASDDPPDAVVLNAHLVKARNLHAVEELPQILTADTAPALAEKYAEIVRDHARLRTVDDVAAGLRGLVDKARVDQVDSFLAEALQRLDDTVGRLGPRPIAHTTWAPVDLEQVLAGDYLDPPPTMLRRSDGIPLLYDGAVHTISGESESGKTWLTLLAAVQLLTDGLPVVFLDFEDRADRVIGRLLALGATPTQIRQHFAYIRPDRPLDDDGRTQLAPALTHAVLVILDGVTEAMTMHGFDLNSNEDSAHFQGLLPRWIADHGPAVVMIDHVVKDKEKQDRFALGAQHKLAGIDGVAYIVKMIQPFARGKRGLAKIEVAKDRPGHVREHTFGRTIAEFSLDATASDVILTAHLNPPGEASGRQGQPFEPTHVMEKISRTVQLTPGLSKKALEDLVNGKTSIKRTALELLVTRGYIEARHEARGRIAHHHIKPYYADGDPDDDQPELDEEQTS